MRLASRTVYFDRASGSGARVRVGFEAHNYPIQSGRFPCSMETFDIISGNDVDDGAIMDFRINTLQLASYWPGFLAEATLLWTRLPDQFG
jgi:hypothetical protein